MTSEEDEFMDHAESFVADGVEYKVGEVIPSVLHLMEHILMKKWSVYFAKCVVVNL